MEYVRARTSQGFFHPPRAFREREIVGTGHPVLMKRPVYPDAQVNGSIIAPMATQFRNISIQSNLQPSRTFDSLDIETK